VRAFSSVGKSVPLIRERSQVRILEGPQGIAGDGDVAQLGERRLCKAEVRGSNPLIST